MRHSAIALLALVSLVAWLLTLHVARREFHLTPDAVDYLTIARQRTLGRGWTMPIKWQWFYESPAVHPALGERSLGWPAVARWATLINPIHPGPSAQVLNTLLIAAAAAIWALVAAQVAGAALAGWLMAALLLTSANTLVVAVTALSEPLYLIELGVLALVLSPRSANRLSPDLAALLAGFLAMAAYLTRPSGPVVIAAVALHLLLNVNRGATPLRRLRPFAIWLAVVVPLLALWKFAEWRAWGGHPHSLMRAHLVCMDITEGMFAGWGLAWPTPAQFFASHWPAILAKVGDHALVYTESLLAPSALGLLSPLLALVAVGALGAWRPWSLLWLLAAGHWLAAVATWATTDTLRLAIPATVCLLPLCVGEGARLIALARHAVPPQAAAALLVGVTLALGAHDMVMKSAQLADPRMGGRPVEEPPIPVPLEYSPTHVVCTDSPFVLAYRSDLACVIFPFDLPERAGTQPIPPWTEFLRDLQVSHFALRSSQAVESIAQLVTAGVLRPLPDVPDPEFQWFEVMLPNPPAPFPTGEGGE